MNWDIVGFVFILLIYTLLLVHTEGFLVILNKNIDFIHAVGRP